MASLFRYFGNLIAIHIGNRGLSISHLLLLNIHHLVTTGEKNARCINREDGMTSDVSIDPWPLGDRWPLGWPLTLTCPADAAATSACCNASLRLGRRSRQTDQSHCSRKLTTSSWPFSAATTRGHWPHRSQSFNCGTRRKRSNTPRTQRMSGKVRVCECHDHVGTFWRRPAPVLRLTSFSITVSEWVLCHQDWSAPHSLSPPSSPRLRASPADGWRRCGRRRRRASVPSRRHRPPPSPPPPLSLSPPPSPRLRASPADGWRRCGRRRRRASVPSRRHRPRDGRRPRRRAGATRRRCGRSAPPRTAVAPSAGTRCACSGSLPPTAAADSPKSRADETAYFVNWKVINVRPRRAVFRKISAFPSASGVF